MRKQDVSWSFLTSHLFWAFSRPTNLTPLTIMCLFKIHTRKVRRNGSFWTSTLYANAIKETRNLHLFTERTFKLIKFICIIITDRLHTTLKLLTHVLIPDLSHVLDLRVHPEAFISLHRLVGAMLAVGERWLPNSSDSTGVPTANRTSLCEEKWRREDGPVSPKLVVINQILRYENTVFKTE
jgi:hypothetical protein